MSRRLEALSDRHVLIIILFAAVAASAASLILAVSNQQVTLLEWWAEWLQNVGSEMLGAFVTFMLIHLLVGGREEKGRLIRQMRIRDNALALQAVEELKAKGWLGDGSLDGASLINADLVAVRLRDARLRRVDLHGACLRASKLDRVDLSGANLWAADLRDAGMKNVNLEGADLYHADLQGVKMIRVEMDERTRLPDGRRWSPEEDINRFTDSTHPGFWSREREVSD